VRNGITFRTSTPVTGLIIFYCTSGSLIKKLLRKGKIGNPEEKKRIFSLISLQCIFFSKRKMSTLMLQINPLKTQSLKGQVREQTAKQSNSSLANTCLEEQDF
jgi:ERCC4-related helicase